ncbi:hypothetical protein [Pontimicrobium sp. MEBiC06410]
MKNETIQCIVISEDANYKTKVEHFLKANGENVTIILTNTLMDALMYLDEKPPFKLLIRKPNKPLEAEDIENCRRVVERDMNFRIVVFQKEHKDLTMLLNLSSLRFLQQEKGLFAKMKLKTVLKQLSGK